jgi:hypothetical protein
MLERLHEVYVTNIMLSVCQRVIELYTTYIMNDSMCES